MNTHVRWIAGLGALLALTACDKKDAPAAVQAPQGAGPISAANCRAAIEIKPMGSVEFTDKVPGVLVLNVSVTNKGNARWGGTGHDMRLGAAWFNAPKAAGSSVAPDHGEQWWPLPSVLNPGETVKFDITASVPGKAGNYEAWFSMLNPGTMWCFHVGDPPAKLDIRVRSSAK